MKDPAWEPRPLGKITIVIPIVVLILSVLGMMYHQDVKQALHGLQSWSARQGAAGPVVFGIVYAIAIVFFVPGTIMTALATASFGPFVAILLISVFGIVGATLAFLIARYCLRGFVAARLEHDPRFRWLEQHIEKRGALFVVVARVVPVLPGNVLHYAFGLTCVRLDVFVFWSFVASIPGLLLFVTGLSTVLRLVTRGDVAPGQLLALAAVVAVQAFLIKWASGVVRSDGEDVSPSSTTGDSGAPLVG